MNTINNSGMHPAANSISQHNAGPADQQRSVTERIPTEQLQAERRRTFRRGQRNPDGLRDAEAHHPSPGERAAGREELESQFH